MKQISFLLLIACIASIFYFSWLPNPDFASESYLPLKVIHWSNYYYNLRTAVPFVAFGFLLEASLSLGVRSKKTSITFNSWSKSTCSAIFIVCLAEGGQFFILSRHPDEMDILFGVLGSQIGFVIFYILKVLKT
jgi:VanZ family protein